jgi:hypothetical protein
MNSIRIIATICQISDPSSCHSVQVTNSELATLSVMGCQVGQPQLANFMTQYPGWELRGWECQIGSVVPREHI